MIEDGAAVGVVLDTPTGPLEVRADRGVILASGGFEWDDELTRAFLRGPMTHPVSMETCTGDGLRMAMRAGAALSNMREAWWIPVGEVPKDSNPTGKVLVNGQRTLPHSIMVNKRGRRFTNEAANYNAFGAALHVEDVSKFEYANLPCWLVFDQQYVDRYGLRVASGNVKGDVPDWLPKGDTPAELAARLGVDGDGLDATIERWNANCADGHDPDFGRGDSAFDCWWGDPHRKGRRDAALGPLTQGPYYAYQLHSGCLGTKGGPRIDPDARVLDLDGQPIAGLYAAGNVMGSPFGMTTADRAARSARRWCSRLPRRPARHAPGLTPLCRGRMLGHTGAGRDACGERTKDAHTRPQRTGHHQADTDALTTLLPLIVPPDGADLLEHGGDPPSPGLGDQRACYGRRIGLVPSSGLGHR